MIAMVMSRLSLDLLEQIDGVVGVGARHAGGRFVEQQKLRLLLRHIAISSRRLSPRDSEAAIMSRLSSHVDFSSSIASAALDVRSPAMVSGVHPEGAVALGEAAGSACFPTRSDRRRSPASGTRG
jgi:hypothetical protein